MEKENNSLKKITKYLILFDNILDLLFIDLC